MSPSSFDSFVLNAATRYGIALYIVFTLAFLSFAVYAGNRLARRRLVLGDFTTLFLLQLAVLGAFLAFAALVGHFPKQLWLATLAVGCTGWLIQRLLVWTTRLSHLLSGVETNLERVSTEARIVQAIVTSDSLIVMALAGLLGGIQLLLQLGFLIYCAFLFDPAQMGNPTYHATIATYVLILPAALQLIPFFITGLILLTSRYATPTIRNIYLASAVVSVVNSSILVFGPLYIYRDGFPTLASAIPPVGTLVLYLIVVSACLLIVPYLVGYLRNGLLVASLRASRLKFIARAQELSGRGADSAYRKQEEVKLQNNILTAYEALARNNLLVVFGLKLLEGLAVEPGGNREYRLALLQRLGFGSSPVEEIQSLRKELIAAPLHRFNIVAQQYFEAVEKDPDGVAEAHPLLANLRNLTTILGALVDSAPDSKDVFADHISREKAEGKVWKWITQTLPFWVFNGIWYMFLQVYSVLGPRIQALFDGFIRTISEGLWRPLLNW